MKTKGIKQFLLKEKPTKFITGAFKYENNAIVVCNSLGLFCLDFNK